MDAQYIGRSVYHITDFLPKILPIPEGTSNTQVQHPPLNTKQEQQLPDTVRKQRPGGHKLSLAAHPLVKEKLALCPALSNTERHWSLENERFFFNNSASTREGSFGNTAAIHQIVVLSMNRFIWNRVGRMQVNTIKTQNVTSFYSSGDFPPRISIKFSRKCCTSIKLTSVNTTKLLIYAIPTFSFINYYD